jgi:hypothetical protein
MFPKGAIHLNYEHPSFAGKKIDIYLPSYAGQDAVACELKYDRRIPSGHNQPRTMKAGAILNDAFRLAHFSPTDEVERFLVYLTDSEMFKYLAGMKGEFSRLFVESNRPRSFVDDKFVQNFADSAQKMLKVPLLTCTLVTVLSRDLAWDHHLFVLLVKP